MWGLRFGDLGFGVQGFRTSGLAGLVALGLKL